MIPADKWPEWADRHCWDACGHGRFYGHVVSRVNGAWVTESDPSGIPLPPGHDWRFPVMRHHPTEAELARELCESVIHAYYESGEFGSTVSDARHLLSILDSQSNP